MNTYELIREIRNERLGEQKLEKDCEFRWNYDLWTVNGIINNTIFAFSFTGDIHDLAFVEQEDKWEYKYKRFDKDGEDMEDIKILGKPVTIADILLMMNDKIMSPNHVVSISSNGYVFELINNQSNKEKPNLFKFDLTKEIKNQDCLKEIYELIK